MAPPRPREPVGSPARRPHRPFMVVLDFFIVNVAMPSMQPRPARGPDRHRMGRRRLRPDAAAGLIAAGRLGDRARPPAHVRDRTRALHRRLGRLRPRSDGASCSSQRVSSRALGAALVLPQVLAIVERRLSTAPIAPVRSASTAWRSAWQHVGGQLIGGAARRGRPARTRLARVLPDQRADRSRRARPGSAPRARVAGCGSQPDRPAGNRARDARAASRSCCR